MEEIQKATDALVEDGLIAPMEYGQLTLSTVGTYISMIPSGPLPRPKWFNVNVASQTVGQGLAKSTEELGKSGAFRGKTPAAIDGFMYQYAGRTYAGLGSCGSKCHQSLQDALTVLTKEGKTNKEGLEEFESTLKLIQERNTTNNYLTDISDDFAEAAWRISSKGCRATHSFAPDTLVLAAKGFLPISQLKINDQVLAYNEATQQNGYYPITAVHKHLDPSITTLKLQTPDGLFETITTTPEHPFYVTAKAGNGVRPRPVGHADLNERWVGAGHLQSGDKLKLADGREGSVVNVTTQAKTQEMFNLTVQQAHTFYVGTNGWLVHNTVCSPIEIYNLRAKYDGYFAGRTGTSADPIQHIILGETSYSWNSTTNEAMDKAFSGGHLESRLPGQAVVTDIVQGQHGVYTGKIRFTDSEGIVYPPKKSTFFPKNMSPEEVIEEIVSARQNAIITSGDSYFIARSKSGILIKGHINSMGEMYSAYPVMEP
ncbi:polymorphic toxin-type HINT domain-containing protein [Deinococcus lacus]|uniref:Polymorphic toxin-type HINT domain-containing protein n=1 Tax=Deinococcus lacus TaxID=392561 RepID=A0ABW1YFR9_9DEIO